MAIQIVIDRCNSEEEEDEEEEEVLEALHLLFRDDLRMYHIALLIWVFIRKCLLHVVLATQLV